VLINAPVIKFLNPYFNSSTRIGYNLIGSSNSFKNQFNGLATDTVKATPAVINHWLS